MNRTFVFWFYWGAEIRVFVFSGLIDYLVDHGEVVVCARFLNQDLMSSADPRVRWIQSTLTKGSAWQSRFHSFANRVHWLWLCKRSEGMAVLDRAAVAGDTEPLNTLREVGAKAFARRPVVNLVNKLASRALDATVEDLNWLSPMDLSKGATILVSSDYLSVAGVRTIRAAKKRKLATVFYPSNWRDVYKGARLSPPFNDWIMWNAKMVDAARRNNPWLGNARFREAGSTQFDSHFRSDWFVPREKFCTMLGTDPNRPLICYSAVSDSAFKGEAEIVEQIIDALQKSEIGRSVQVVVRLNPAGSDPCYRDLCLKYPQTCFMQSPEWWIERPPDGAPIWRSNTPADARMMANLIEHCLANVGLPSTMMLDFAVKGRPSICIGFDPSECKGGTTRAKDFLDQEFIRPALEQNVWPVASSATDVAELIVKCIKGTIAENKAAYNFVTATVGSCDGKVHQRLAQDIISICDRVRQTRR